MDMNSQLVKYYMNKRKQTEDTYESDHYKLVRDTAIQHVFVFTFCNSARFITMFTTACHLPLSKARSIQSNPSHPVPLISISKLPSHLHLGLPSDLFASGSPTKTLAHGKCPAPLITLDLITLITYGEQQKSWIPHYAVLSCLLLLSPSQAQTSSSETASNITGTCSSFDVRHQVSHSQQQHTQLGFAYRQRSISPIILFASASLLLVLIDGWHRGTHPTPQNLHQQAAHCQCSISLFLSSELHKSRLIKDTVQI